MTYRELEIAMQYMRDMEEKEMIKVARQSGFTMLDAFGKTTNPEEVIFTGFSLEKNVLTATYKTIWFDDDIEGHLLCLNFISFDGSKYTYEISGTYEEALKNYKKGDLGKNNI
jgi:hypothetical protein